MFWLPFVLVLARPHQSSSREECKEGIYKGMTQSELFAYLTDECRYKKYERPPTLYNTPLYVRVNVYIYHLKASASTSSTNLDLEVQMLLEMKWTDPRLKFDAEDTGISLLIGEKYLLDSIWLPHVLLSNEKESIVMGPLRKDDLITVLPSGDVMYTNRLKTSLTCHLQIEQFPFDRQTCELKMDNWRFNISEVRLIWDELSPNGLHWGEICLAEFYLIDMYTSSSYVLYQRSLKSYNYSSLILTFKLGREYGFYLMDYYVPSILLVILSWISFWFSPDAIPARCMLGASTLLTFLLLSWTGDAVPKVSQFQINDIWELSCTAFIFLSLAEFAFVNTIDRRKSENVHLKKRTSKYILKYSVSPTPRETCPRINLRRSSSCPSSPEIRRNFMPKYNKSSLKIIEELKAADFSRTLRRELAKVKEEQEELENKTQHEHSHTMTPQQIAKWIDEKSRFIFPASFLIFNLLYWGFILLP